MLINYNSLNKYYTHKQQLINIEKSAFLTSQTCIYRTKKMEVAANFQQYPLDGEKGLAVQYQCAYTEGLFFFSNKKNGTKY